MQDSRPRFRAFVQSQFRQHAMSFRDHNAIEYEVEEYNKLAERCCDADPDKRPDAYPLWRDICKLVQKVKNYSSVNNAWNTIYHNDVKPLSRLEKESKYSSKLLPTGDLPKPRNNYDLDSAAGTKTTISYMLIS